MSKKYLIVNVSELEKINFNLILNSSILDLRYSYNKDKCIIKWLGEDPDFLSELDYKDGPYTLQQITEILHTSVWDGVSYDYSVANANTMNFIQNNL